MRTQQRQQQTLEMSGFQCRCLLKKTVLSRTEDERNLGRAWGEVRLVGDMWKSPADSPAS